MPALWLVKLGHVALDGTKIQANASKHKAMSYERMCDAQRQLEQEVSELLGKEKVAAEWLLICLTHNLLKLFQAKTCLQAL